MSLVNRGSKKQATAALKSLWSDRALVFGVGRVWNSGWGLGGRWEETRFGAIGWFATHPLAFLHVLARHAGFNLPTLFWVQSRVKTGYGHLGAGGRPPCACCLLFPVSKKLGYLTRSRGIVMLILFHHKTSRKLFCPRYDMTYQRIYLCLDSIAFFILAYRHSHSNEWFGFGLTLGWNMRWIRWSSGERNKPRTKTQNRLGIMYYYYPVYCNTLLT